MFCIQVGHDDFLSRQAQGFLQSREGLSHVNQNIAESGYINRAYFLWNLINRPINDFRPGIFQRMSQPKAVVQLTDSLLIFTCKTRSINLLHRHNIPAVLW